MENHARGGTSSRTFRSLGLWKPVLDKLKKGDYVFMQFGHNDAGALNDSTRARGTIKGVGDEFEIIDNFLTGQQETVYSYGWYLSQYINEIKQKGAIPIVVAPIPRNRWSDDKVPNNEESYGGWAREVANREGVMFIELNKKMVAAMEVLGQEKVTDVLFFSHDHTHPSAQGALLAASLVVEAIKEMPACELNKFLLNNPEIVFPVKKRMLLIGDSTVANGRDSIAGWGMFLDNFLDTTRIEVINRARGGRSSRTFYDEGLWDSALEMLQNGDFLFIQFGHNDGGVIDKPKFRASINGIGDESSAVLRDDGVTETVYSFGWYLRKYISDAKAKGATVIVLSHIPRNRWEDGKVFRNNNDYGLWSKQVAEQKDALFIDFNELIASYYEEMGQDKVAALFPKDNTHTNEDGALLNASILAKALSQRNSPLRGFVK